MTVKILVNDEWLVKFYGLRKGKVVKVLPKKNKWRGIQVEGVEQTGNFTGRKCSIFLKKGEYILFEIS